MTVGAWKSFTQFLFGKQPQTIPSTAVDQPIPKRRTPSESHRNLEKALEENATAAKTVMAGRSLKEMMEDDFQD